MSVSAPRSELVIREGKIVLKKQKSEPKQVKLRRLIIQDYCYLDFLYGNLMINNKIMIKRTKTFIITLIVLSIILLAVTVIWITINSQDIPMPDTSDLAFKTVVVPDMDNAYIYFKKARELFYSSEQESNQVKSILSGGAWDEELLKGLISKNNEVLNLIKRGLECPIYQRLDDPRLEKFQSLVKLVKIAKLVALRTTHERQTMQSEQALNSCLDLLSFGSLIIAHPGSLIEYIIGLSILESGLKETRQLLDESYLTETQLLRLSEHLKKISSLDEGLISAIKVDFHFVSEMIHDFDSEFQNDDSTKYSITHQFFRRYCFQPNRTKRMFAARCRTMINNASKPYADMDLPKVIFFDSDVRMFIQKLRPNGLAKLLLPHSGFYNSFLRGKCEPQACLTAIRLVVACRIYETKHGHLPDTLEHLVPLFFDDVPRDPFDGEPFRYLPKQAVVYSVGKNIKDSGIPKKTTVNTVISKNNKRGKKTNDLFYNIHGDLENIAPADVSEQ